jgi:hypothetical protein
MFRTLFGMLMFQRYQIKRETYRLYLHRDLVAGDAFWIQDQEPQFGLAC